MNGIRNTYLYVCGSQRLLDIRRIYTSAGLIGLNISLYFSQQFVSFLSPETLGEKIQRSSVYIKWLMMVPA